MSFTPRFAWHNGEIVPWDDCVVHVRTQGAFWGANVFEGVRAYWQADEAQLRLFRLQDHLDRLHRSMKCIAMPCRYPDEEIRSGCEALLRANEVTGDAHVCIVGYFGMGPNFDPLCYTEDAGLHITAIPAPRSPRFHVGASACISSWRRISDDTMPPRIKTGANYHNSRLAQHEAIRNGYDTCLITNQRGTVSEAPGACFVMVRDGRLITPPGTSGVLEGITLATIETLAHDMLGVDLERREIDRTELYLADELFLCGTLAEITPITTVDRIVVGSGQLGAMTKRLQAAFEATVRGTDNSAWSTSVYAGSERQARKVDDAVEQIV